MFGSLTSTFCEMLLKLTLPVVIEIVDAPIFVDVTVAPLISLPLTLTVSGDVPPSIGYR